MRSNMYLCRLLCVMMAACFCHLSLKAQGNCLIYAEGSDERKACEYGYKAIEHRQGSLESQLLLNQAIELNPNYAWAYYQKSVPYFKRGMFAEGLGLINKAIELEPKRYLFYRAYYYFYNRSYDYCIKDLEQLYTQHEQSYITTPGGALEMRLLLAMSYAQKGDVPAGINWIHHLMDFYQAEPRLKGAYDHYCLGVLYFKNDQLDLAEEEFARQIEFNETFATSYYYLGLIKQKQELHSLAEEYFREAHARMKGEKDGYNLNIFGEWNVYEEDIRTELN